jgi:hypothetical protein
LNSTQCKLAHNDNWVAPYTPPDTAWVLLSCPQSPPPVSHHAHDGRWWSIAAALGPVPTTPPPAAAGPRRPGGMELLQSGVLRGNVEGWGSCGGCVWEGRVQTCVLWHRQVLDSGTLHLWGCCVRAQLAHTACLPACLPVSLPPLHLLMPAPPPVAPAGWLPDACRSPPPAPTACLPT